MAHDSGGSNNNNGGTASLRQSSRTKKPSRRAEEMYLAESVEAAAVTTTTNNKRQKSAASSQQKKSNKTKTAKGGASKRQVEEDGGEYDENGSQEEEEVDEAEIEEAEDKASDEEEEDSQKSSESFCLCRKGDDGRPMVFCAQCHDWFHFKCVGLTKKVAEQLSEFICPPCQSSTGKKSKTLDDIQEEENATSSPARDESYSPPPRRSSAATKRKSSQEDFTRKRSRSSPQSPKIKEPSSSSRPAEPVRKSSGSYNVTAPSGSTAAVKQRSETLRKHAVDQLAGTFDTIFAEQPDQDTQENQGYEYAVSFEESLFELNSEVIAKTTIRIAGKSYRDRLRTFLFNLKDKNNTSLRQKISSKELKADSLAAMSNDELANDEIRKEVEQRKKENLEQSILKKEEAPLRKLTHKGEIDIDYENAHMSRLVAERENEKQVVDAHQDFIRKASDETKKESNLTMSPVSSEFKASDGSPVAGTAPASAPRRISTCLQSPTRSFDFANVWTGEPVREGEGEDGEDAAPVEEEIAADGEQDLDEGNEKAEEHADNFIDDFLGMPEEKNNNADQKDGAEDVAQEESPTEAEEEAFKWRGAVSMPDEGVCTGKVRQVAGRELLDQEWKALFPSVYSIIEGRLPSSSAAPYLVQSQLAPRTELVVMTFESSWQPESLSQLPIGTTTPSNENENNESFEKLLSYFQRRDRYGVLPPHPSARGSFVKDFYISPLPKVGMVPQWMEMMRAREFQGEASHSRVKEAFLLVAVLFRQNLRLPVENPAYSPTHGGSASVTTNSAAASGAVSPPTFTLRSILGGSGSNTLQDLLKAVGGNRSPATPLAAGYQSPFTHASQDQSVTLQQHPSIETLREMPRPQLEEMMYKNPSLVDQLLKTLGATKAPSPSPPTRPPGPPPPPPPALANHYQHSPYPHPSIYGNPQSQQQQQVHSPGYPPQNDYNYRGPPQPPYPQYPSVGNQGWRPNPSYPSPYPPNQSATPSSNHQGPPIRGGYNQRGGPPLPNQRRY